MDGETKRTAEGESLQHAVLDLEQVIEYQNRILLAFLGIATFFGALAIWLLWRLDAMNVISMLAG